MSTFSFISQCRPEYSENLFNANSVITDQSQVNKISGSALSSISIDSENFYEKYKSLKLYNNSITTPLVVNVWNAFGFVTNNDGNHILSLRVLHKQVTPFDHKLKVNVFANSIFSHSIELSITETNRNEWLTFSQSFNVSSGVEIGLTFEFTLDPTDPTEQCELWIGGLKIEYDDRNLGNPSIYTLPRSIYEETGFQSRTDETNNQSLLSLTDNLISFTGILEQNGGLELTDSNAKITPIGLNDIISVDFAFTGVVPVGTNLFLSIYLKVDGNIFRAVTLPIIKGAGLDDYFSVSWILPVGADFLTNGATIHVNPLVAMTIKNRYLSVTRLAKGK